MNLIIKMRYGSHVYGTSLPTSDEDIKAVFLPPANDILLQRVQNNISMSTKTDASKANTSADTDLEMFSLQKFVDLLLEGQTVAFDMLFTPPAFYLMEPHAAWTELKKQEKYFLHRGLGAMARYCQRQAAKYGIKGSRIAALRETLAWLGALPKDDRLEAHAEPLARFAASTAGVALITVVETHRTNPGRYLEVCDRKVPIDARVAFAMKVFQKTFDSYGERALQAERNEGVDWKALMHAVRVTEEAKELLLNGHVTFPRPERALLRKIRHGEVAYSEVAERIETGIREIDEARKVSNLPETANVPAAEQFVCQWYRSVLKVRHSF